MLCIVGEIQAELTKIKGITLPILHLVLKTKLPTCHKQWQVDARDIS